ncbi:hypothetical protein RHMOL_Rhmol08G0103300 [Rhododendron molle]|uniref:Uncharacterized protein n=1 Tax=Rhododendron molle TaxID=49168 RepID=A0ACC0MM60_RHOML|nr:hypothetical protein RHMOL_Rhmol08G0103300 [Rhododendron molle]
MGGLVELVILLILLTNSHGLGIRVAPLGFANFTQVSSFAASSSSCNASCNATEEKRGIPTGADPLHNR